MYISSIHTNFADGSQPAEVYLIGPTAQRWALTKFPVGQTPTAAMLADPSFRVVINAEKSADFLRWVQAAIDPNTSPSRPLWQTWGDDVLDRLQTVYNRVTLPPSTSPSVGNALARDRSFSGAAQRPQISPETLAFAVAVAASDGRDDQIVFGDITLPIGAVLPQYGVRVYDATNYAPGRFSASAWTEAPAPVAPPPTVPPVVPPPVTPPVVPPVTPPAPPVTPTAPPGHIQVAAKVSIVPWLLGAAAVAGVAWWLWPKSDGAPHSNPSHSFIGSHVTRLGHGAAAGRHGTILSLEGHGPMMKATVRWEDGSVGVSHGKDLGLIG